MGMPIYSRTYFSRKSTKSLSFISSVTLVVFFGVNSTTPMVIVTCASLFTSLWVSFIIHQRSWHSNHQEQYGTGVTYNYLLHSPCDPRRTNINVLSRKFSESTLSFLILSIGSKHLLVDFIGLGHE